MKSLSTLVIRPLLTLLDKTLGPVFIKKFFHTTTKKYRKIEAVMNIIFALRVRILFLRSF